MWESSTTPEILFSSFDCYRSQRFFYFAVLAAHFAPCCDARSVEYSYFAVLAAHFAPCCDARSVEYSRTLPSLRVLQNANCIHDNSQNMRYICVLCLASLGGGWGGRCLRYVRLVGLGILGVGCCLVGCLQKLWKIFQISLVYALKTANERYITWYVFL